MNRLEIIETLRKYNFDPNNYIVLSGASMVLQGLKKETKDIDIAVSKEYYNVLEKQYNCEVEKVVDGKKVYYIDNIINFGSSYYDRDEVIYYEGFPIQNIEGIKKLKHSLGREKDIDDINKIDKYLNINSLALAYMGDSVYEVYIRKYLLDKGLSKVDELQKNATKYVSAKIQADILNNLINNNILREEELEVVRKGRNTKSHKAPKNTDIVTYHKATGFESLIGYLYLKNDFNRLNTIIKEIVGE